METTGESQNAALRVMMDKRKVESESLSPISLPDLMLHSGAGTHLLLLPLLELKMCRVPFFTKQSAAALLKVQLLELVDNVRESQIQLPSLCSVQSYKKSKS